MLFRPLDKDVVRLNSGVPSADFFPMAAFRRSVEAVLRREGSAALQYQPVEGNGPLREAIAAYLERRGTPVRPEDVLICSGAVSSVHIAVRFLAMPGDVLLTENPVYSGCLSALEGLGVKVVGIPLDDEGMRVDVAERLIRQYRPKAIYTIPTYNNPTGVCLSLERRRALLALSRREGVPLIEEDYANEIGFTGPPPPTLKAMDGAGQIIHVKSFAKLVFPSIRIAAVAAPASMIRGLLGVKEGIDPYASGLNQLILHELLRQPEFSRHVEGLAGRYRPRYEAMREALRHRAGRHLTWIEPKGGVNVWARLPDGLNSQDLLPEAIEAGVAFTPGRSFVPDRGGEDCLRLSFGNVTPAQIDSGISRLVKVIQRERARQRRRPLAEPMSASMLL
jgi:DNA-binding transcriptional MocR family regulator